MRSLWAVVALTASGCWLDGVEWAEKRRDAGVVDVVPSQPVVADLGLGSCVQSLFDGSDEGRTDSLTNASDATCSTAAGPDVSLAWDVPDDGCWVLSARGSSFDTVLSGRDACGGETLFCGVDGVVITELEEGPTLIVVDGEGAADDGEWKLSASPLVTDDIGTNTTADGTLVGQPTWEDFACEGPISGAASYVRFTPATTGRWRIELNSAVAGVLSVHKGCDLETAVTCTDAEANQTQSVVLQLNALEEVVVRVGGRWESGASQPAAGLWDLTFTIE